MNGVLLVNKEKDVTSRDVVNDLVHFFNTKKIGHTGTLDPIATGVLVVTIGKYTKLNDVLTSTYKEYIATMKLGIKTDTLDITGKVIEEKNVSLTEEEITGCFKHFICKYEQEVPLYSAVKVNGKKLYEYARKNESVELPKKEVEIKRIELLSMNESEVIFKCLVSKGTFIRSLIRDIGEYLNIPTTMSDLIRTKQGKFNIEDSFAVDDIRKNKYSLLTLKYLLDVEEIELDEELFKKIINGQKFDYKSQKDFLLFTKNNEEVALYKKDNDIYRMFIKLI
ncbi:MAG: tRNA pseudouridine(55) synthase TruB [Erysipelotrichales bacterium]|nr:tRNA pseudouridine(55) synthase TruB [Erysipelotrichales bacterium]